MSDTAQHDLVIRGATVIDGSGQPGRIADIAVDDGLITLVGEVPREGRTEIDARGKLATPGFVDIHTHYDGQVSWDDLLTPSSLHGVTTVVMGNCGVGFAPVKPEDRDWLINLMEGVEDIPGSVLAEGISWDWTSFPEYLDAIDQPRAIDFGAQLPHGALRLFVMGQRGADHESRPTAAELTHMQEVVAEAVRAGALGWSTSRTSVHKAADGSSTPSLTASREELLSMARGLADVGDGVVDLISDFIDQPEEMDFVRAVAKESGRPVSVSITQAGANKDKWRTLLDQLQAIGEETGVPVRGQVASRAIGVMLGWELSWHPFMSCPAYQEISGLPVAERLAELRRPEVRAAILAQTPVEGEALHARLSRSFADQFILGTPANYEPGPEDSIAATAARAGVDPAEAAYDHMMTADGTGLLYFPMLNYLEGNLDACAEMLEHPITVPALGDGGAHCGAICDASFPTTMLTLWGRDRVRGKQFPIEWLVKCQTADTAEALGLGDRGRIEPGLRADLNVIDFDRLQVGDPEVRYDLPTGGRRLMQTAAGYEATIVAGEIVFREGEHTGALPGRLVRGSRASR